MVTSYPFSIKLFIYPFRKLYIDQSVFATSKIFLRGIFYPYLNHPIINKTLKSTSSMNLTLFTYPEKTYLNLFTKLAWDATKPWLISYAASLWFFKQYMETKSIWRDRRCLPFGLYFLNCFNLLHKMFLKPDFIPTTLLSCCL